MSPEEFEDDMKASEIGNALKRFLDQLIEKKTQLAYRLLRQLRKHSETQYLMIGPMQVCDEDGRGEEYTKIIDPRML